MGPAAVSPDRLPPAFRRLTRLAPLDRADLTTLQAAAYLPRTTGAKRDLTASIASATGPVLVLDGWASRACLLSDGRRQITELFLPGDIVSGPSADERSLYSVGALTSVTWCVLDPASHRERG